MELNRLITFDVTNPGRTQNEPITSRVLNWTFSSNGLGLSGTSAKSS